MKKRLLAGLLAMTLVFSDASITLANEYVESNTYEETEDYSVSLLEDTSAEMVTVTACAGVGVSAV